MPPLNVQKEVSPLVVKPSLPSDPALRVVLDDVLAQLRYSFTVAAIDEHAAPGDIDQTLRTFVASRKPSSRARSQERSQTLLKAPIELRADHFGRYADLKPELYRTMGSEGMASRFGNPKVASADLVKSLERLQTGLAFAPIRPKPIEVQHNTPQGTVKLDPDVIGGLFFRKMRLYINWVKCIEETDEIGDDEINIGGTVTDPFGKTLLVNQFEVSREFDTGEVVNFGTSKVFATWNLETNNAGFPYVYSAVIAMAEKDDGGFYKFLKALWEKVGAMVKKAIAGLVGAAIGGAIGSAFGPLGTAIGAIVGIIVGYFLDWIINLFDNKDDIVGVIPVLMTLASSRRSYYDWARLTSAQGWKPKKPLRFNGAGGRYEVDYAFKVFTK